MEKQIYCKNSFDKEKTGAKNYDAFTSLHDPGYDLNGAVNYLLYGIMDESQADYFHLFFESHIWQKLDYIMESALCSPGQAFKFLVEFNEDKLAAAEALKTGET